MLSVSVHHGVYNTIHFSPSILHCLLPLWDKAFLMNRYVVVDNGILYLLFGTPMGVYWGTDTNNAVSYMRTTRFMATFSENMVDLYNAAEFNYKL
jgi:hypothetical protein